ncbi:hypothetical protein P3342_001203 [Pyrenophora teres f. teres]|nr:hypothetical protein P3342_001203 [Pyrenophora teres f. teres]
MAEPKPPTATRNSYRQYLGKLESHDAHAPRFNGENILEFLDEYDFEADRSRTLARRDAEIVEELILALKKSSVTLRQAVPRILPIVAQPEKLAAPKVDKAVEDLIQRFQGLSMTIEQLNEMAEGNVGLQRLLVKPENYAEVYKQLVLRPHRKQVRYYFGPYPTTIWGVFPGGGIAPKPFGSEVLEWILQSLKERFKREREARLGKKPGIPQMKSSRTASSYEDMDVEEEPEVLRHRARVEIDDSQVPETQVQRRLDTPMSNGTRKRDSRSVTVDHDIIPALAPVPRAPRASASVTIPTTEDLAAMARNTAPTVLAKAMLNQEVRGIRQLDLLASPEVAAAVTKALEEARRPRVHFQVGETRLGETMEVQQAEASSDEDELIEEAVQRLYDWGSGETSQPKN